MEIRGLRQPDVFVPTLRRAGAPAPLDRSEAIPAWRARGAELASTAAAAALPPGPVALELARQLVAEGAEFQTRGRNWMLRQTWKPADPEKVARELDKQEPHLQVRQGQEDWNTLADRRQLADYRAFHGGETTALEDPDLGRALAFTQAPGPAYRAYAQLTRASEPPDAQPPLDRESVLFTAFERGGLDSKALADPARALGLKTLTDQGYTLSSGSALESYRQLPDRVEVLHNGLPVGVLTPAQVSAPPLEPLARTRAQADRLRERAQDQTEAAWRLIRLDGSARPLAERVELAASLLGPDLATLYPAVLRNTIDPAPLQETRDELMALRQALGGQPAARAVEALEVGRRERLDRERWMQAVTDTRDPQLARRALAVLEGSPDPASSAAGGPDPASGATRAPGAAGQASTIPSAGPGRADAAQYARREAAFRALCAHAPEAAVQVAEGLGSELPTLGPELGLLLTGGLSAGEALGALQHCREQKLDFEPERVLQARELLAQAGLEPSGWTRIYPGLPQQPERRAQLSALAGQLKDFQPTVAALEGILALPPGADPQVARLAQDLKSADHAVQAWNQWLGQDQAHPEFEQRRSTLLDLIREQGWEAGSKTYQELRADTLPWEERVKVRQAASQIGVDYARLRQANLDAAQAQALAELSAGLRPVARAGEWSIQGDRWANRLDLGASIDNRLDLGPISLAGLKQCSLTFHHQLDLRHESNQAVVEVSPDAEHWEELVALGKDPVGSVDLSRFDGKSLHLRFEVKPKAWDHGGPGDALAVSGLTLSGLRQGQPQVAFQAGGAEPSDLLQHPEQLLGLALLAREAGGAVQALSLSRLAPPQDWPALGSLAAELGPGPAAAAWPRLKTGQAPLLSLAARLSAPDASVDSLLALSDRLASLQLSPGSIATLEGKKPARWESEGAWDYDGRTWRNRLYIGASVANRLVTPPIPLDHLGEPRLELQLKHDLRVDGNKVEIQVAEEGPDPTWKALREFSGSSDWRPSELDLSEYQGKTVRLRFDVQPKAWDRAGPGNALEIRDLALKGKPRWGAVPSLNLSGSAEALQEALQGLEKLPRARRDPAVEALKELPLELWPVVLALPERIPERARALQELASQAGAGAALKAWPLLDQDGAGDLSRVRWLDLAARIAGPTATLEELEPVYLRLRSHPLDEAGLETIEHMLDSVPRLSTQGRWESQHDPAGTVWSNTLDLGAPLDNRLTTPEVSLQGVQTARLTFEYRHELRTEDNKAFLEVSTDGKEWSPLVKFEGARPTLWARQEADLSAYRGKRVQLRLRVAPAHWDHGGPGRAFQLRGLKVQGRSGPEAPEQVLFEPPREAELARSALDLADQDASALVAVGDLSAQLQDPVKALQLWPALAPARGQPDFEERKAGLIRLAQECGFGQASAAYEQISAEPGGDFSDRVRRYTLAARLAEVSEGEAGLFYPELAAMTAEQTRVLEESLRELQPSLPGWRAVGTWQRLAGPDGKPAWLDRLEIGAPTEQHLTTPPLPLLGLENCRLEFQERHDLRVEGNSAEVQASLDGGHTWKALETISTPKGDWTAHSLDLSGLTGGSAMLRFEVKPRAWDRGGPGEALVLGSLALKGTSQGKPVEVDLDHLNQSMLAGLVAASSTPSGEGLRMLRQLGPEQTWRVLGCLGQALAAGKLAGRDLDRCLTRVVQSLVTGSSLESALEQMLDASGQALEETVDSVIVGGVRIGKREPAPAA